MTLMTSFHKILVTGPQRSGTRIVAKMIAHDNKIRYVSEQQVRIKSMKKANQFLSLDERLVIQCPGLCHCIEELASATVLIVIVVRNVKDIIASQSRIGWTRFEGGELRKYGKTSGIISKVRYAYWEMQKELIPNWLEVKYEDLKDHPMFVPKKERQDFKWNQTERIHKEATL